MINFYCIGRNNVDVYLKYNMVYPGGNCSNVAAHFAKFGYGAALVTVVGQDVLGRLQLKSLEKLGVDGVSYCMKRKTGSLSNRI